MAAGTHFTLLLLVCAVSAYDFSNTFFNQDLHTVMELFHEHSRLVKRDISEGKCEPQSGYIHATCCNGTESFREIGVDAVKNCTADIGTEYLSSYEDPFSCDVIVKKMDQAMCLFQCLLKQVNGSDEDGNLDEDALKNLVDNTIEGENIKSVALEAVSACVNKANNIQSQHARYRTTPYPYSTSYPYYRTGTPYYNTRSYDSYYTGAYTTNRPGDYSTSRPTYYPFTTYRPTGDYYATTRSPNGYYTTGRSYYYTSDNPYYSGTYRPTGATPASMEGKCSSAPLTFMQCFWETVILKCPVDNEVSSKDCDNVRSYLKQQQGNNV